VTVNPAAAAAPPPAQGSSAEAQPGSATDVPAALPRTGGDIPWGALAALAAALPGSSIWLRRR